jgi:hypothetical protein
MVEVIAFNKETNRVDIHLIIDLARIEKTNDPAKAREYYSQAKKIIDDNGGRSYIEKQNKNTDISIDYDEVTNGAL